MGILGEGCKYSKMIQILHWVLYIKTMTRIEEPSGNRPLKLSTLNPQPNFLTRLEQEEEVIEM